MTTVWGIFGTIPTKVMGQGILVEKGALFDVVSLGDGQILDIFVDVDDKVKAGQIVARISQPDIEHQLEEARRTLDHALEERAFVEKLGSDIHTSRSKYINQQRKTLLDSIKLAEIRLDDLHERVERAQAAPGAGHRGPQDLPGRQGGVQPGPPGGPQVPRAAHRPAHLPVRGHLGTAQGADRRGAAASSTPRARWTRSRTGWTSLPG